MLGVHPGFPHRTNQGLRAHTDRKSPFSGRRPIITGKRARSDASIRKRHRTGFARFREIFSKLRSRITSGVRLATKSLDQSNTASLPRAVACIGDIDRERKRISGPKFRKVSPQISVFECSVTQSVAERPLHVHHGIVVVFALHRTPFSDQFCSRHWPTHPASADTMKEAQAGEFASASRLASASPP